MEQKKAKDKTKCGTLFNLIAADTYGDKTPSDSIKLSRKQYYNKLSKLVKVDLIKRKSGRHLSEE
jgi:ribosomal protein L25 (general stress protein Ctc)